MKESTASIGDGRTDGRTLTTGLEVNAFSEPLAGNQTVAVCNKTLFLLVEIFDVVDGVSDLSSVEGKCF